MSSISEGFYARLTPTALTLLPSLDVLKHLTFSSTQVVVAPDQVAQAQRMGMWVPGAIVEAGDLTADGQGSRLVRHRGLCRGLGRC
jgi:hypothetical protein